MAVKKKTSSKVSTKRPTRSAIRFSPDPGTLAQLQFEDSKEAEFGLVLNESAGGCALVLTTKSKIYEGGSCLCKVGNLASTPASIRWVKKLEANLFKIGLKYLL